MEYIDINKKLPKKGKDIIGMTPNNEKKYLFRCNCPNKDCKEWRCSLTGMGVMVEINKWKYE